MARSKKKPRPGRNRDGDSQREFAHQEYPRTSNGRSAFLPSFLTPKSSAAATRHGSALGHSQLPGYTSDAFTLADEARQTSSHDHSLWTEHTKLRNCPVQFVSMGQIEPLKTELPDNCPTGTKADGEKEQGTSTTSFCRETNQSDLALSQKPVFPREACRLSTVQPYGTVNPSVANRFGQMGQGWENSRPQLNGPARISSPESTTSDEVILFRGRNHRIRHQSIIENPGNENPSPASSRTLPQLACDGNGQASASFDVTAKTKRARRNIRKLMSQSPDEDILSDYINNLRDHGEFGSDSWTQNAFTCSKRIERHVDLSSPAGVSNDSQDENGKDSGDEATLIELITIQKLDSDPALVTRKQSSSDLDQSPTHCCEDDPILGQVDFDLLDWERPSIREPKRKKAMRAQLTSLIGVDSDLETQLQIARESDRLRRKARRSQRAELRASGMLRKRANPDDLRLRYPTSMTIEDIAQELRSFLLYENEVIAFPPMDFHARKLVHELANTFNIKSKSTGKADQRRPTLYRTTRTLPLNETALNQAMSRIRRRLVPRLDTKGKRAMKSNMTRETSVAATSYQEGEVVGAAAPELGTGNRGRAMLEKMGWSCGTALGSVDNKGILQPVTHTMKRSKAGLG